MSVWAAIQANQYLFVGMLGLFGVIFALFYNAAQARKQRREEWDHERSYGDSLLNPQLILVVEGARWPSPVRSACSR